MGVKPSYFYADLQGFTESNNFYLKELCILECDNNRSNINNIHTGDKFHHYIFKPPFEWKQLSPDARLRALWLKCMHHGFSWNHGDIDYSKIESIITNVLNNNTGTPIVFVKGDQKVTWFNNFTRGAFSCINIEDLGCIHNLNSLKLKNSLSSKHCRQHDKSLHCALENVDILHYLTKDFLLDR